MSLCGYRYAHSGMLKSAKWLKEQTTDMLKDLLGLHVGILPSKRVQHVCLLPYDLFCPTKSLLKGNGGCVLIQGESKVENLRCCWTKRTGVEREL